MLTAIVLGCGSLGFGCFLTLWQFLAPSPGGNHWLVYFVLLTVGLVGALLVAAVFAVSVVVRTEVWLARLPRANVVFGKTPDLYRE